MTVDPFDFWADYPVSLGTFLLQVPMGIWTRQLSAGSRGTTDTQQWIRNAEERRA